MARTLALGAFLLLALPAVAQPPATFQWTVSDGNTSYTADFSLHSARGPNTSIQVQQPDGSFATHTPGPVRTYIGTIASLPGAMVSGLLRADSSVYYHVMFEDGTEWIRNSGPTSVRTDTTWTPLYPSTVTGSGGGGSDVWAAEIGVDLPFSQYSVDNDVDAALEMIEHSVNTTNLLYLRDASILHRLGRVVIRADAAQDPYAGMTTTSELLDEIRNQWDNVLPPSTHDAGLIATSATGGGLASVGVIGNPGYSSNGSSSEGDFTIVWRHEIGHNWSSNHYEGGTSNQGPEGGTIMSNNALSRMSGSEQVKVVTHRDARLSSLDNLGPYAEPIPPHASMDRAQFLPQGAPFTIDVLDNDHDANGEAFVITAFDAVTQEGGAVQLSPGTGPGGRDELLYTPPTNATAAPDIFTYRIADTAGRESVGNVITALTSESELLAHYPFDDGFGTSASDSSEYLRSANLENGPVWIAGQNGSSVGFDGVDDRVRAPALLKPTDSFTVSAWVRRVGTQTNFAGVALCRSRNTTAGINLVNDELQYQWGSVLWRSGLVPPNDTWTFVALAVSPSSATLYMDAGTGLQSATNVATHGVQPFDAGFSIGRDLSTLRGAIDDVRMWCRTLTQAEIAAAARGLGSVANPQPAHLTGLNASSVMLEWTSWPAATGHRIYFSSSYLAVRDGLAAADQGVQPGTSWNTPLLGNGSWFWRADATDGVDTVPGPVWSFTIQSGATSAFAQTYGAGCLGSQPLPPAIGAVGLPQIGSPTFGIEVMGAAPTTSAALLFSAQAGDAPLSGCRLLLGVPFFASPPVAVDATGRGLLPLPIANNSALLGGRLFTQYVVVDAGGALFGVASMSDGLHLTIGS